MTEKRFTVEGWVILNDGESSRMIEVNDLIESFVEENEQLKKQLEIRTESDKYHQRMLRKWLCKDEDGDDE